MDDILDVAIIGAGISGINTAYRVSQASPSYRYTIFEGRSQIGGTWSFFKYPGLRSDSDLFSFGFEWNPWESDKVIAGAPQIMEYLHRSIRSFGGSERLRMGHKLVGLDWSTKDQLWTLKFRVRRGVGQEGEKDGDNEDDKDDSYREIKQLARWVVLGTGYYDYEKALPAIIPGLDSFSGQIIHPQFWPTSSSGEELDLAGKRVAIIGSGATAITILPVIAQKTSSVTLVQRSPTFLASVPSRDTSADLLKRYLPTSWANRLLRIKYLLVSYLFFTFCQTFPKAARKLLYKGARKQLPLDIGVEPHFAPRYDPWDQRLCACPDGDFFTALREGKASIVTGHIERVTGSSILMQDQSTESPKPNSNSNSNSLSDLDVIITATGLKILIGGGAPVSIDGTRVDLPSKTLWKGCMISDVPNLVAVIGYTNASWTLGADVAAKTLTRLMSKLDEQGQRSATPVVPDDNGVIMNRVSFMKMQSTYLTKGRGDMPSAGDKYPWLPRGNYFSDMWDATYGNVTQDIVSLVASGESWVDCEADYTICLGFAEMFPIRSQSGRS
jgi:cation diffusion facilitator CzcD-associated flavoprotein CzcO